MSIVAVTNDELEQYEQARYDRLVAEHNIDNITVRWCDLTNTVILTSNDTTISIPANNLRVVAGILTNIECTLYILGITK